jgi:hypothetical protein
MTQMPKLEKQLLIAQKLSELQRYKLEFFPHQNPTFSRSEIVKDEEGRFVEIEDVEQLLQTLLKDIPQ